MELGARLPVDFLSDLTTDELSRIASRGKLVALLPVGSVEPHGPHLTLGTDTIISEEVAQRAAYKLRPREGLIAVVAPPIPYGVTDYAKGFAGAVSIPAAVLSAFVRATVEGLFATGFSHVCIINNHLEPAHDAALRSAIEGMDAARVSYACPLNRRWGRTLSEEFKRGECHAGRYETSIVLACDPGVDDRLLQRLPDVPISLSEMIKRGVTDFKSMGLTDAYAGAPRLATREEGEALLEKLAIMVETEVLEHMGLETRSNS